MREDEIEQVKKRARDEYQCEKAVLEQRLADLEINFRAQLQAIGWLEQATDATDRPRSRVNKIRDTVQKGKPKFTRMDIEEALNKAYGETPSRAVIVKALQTMVEEGALRIAVAGRGRRPTVYGQRAILRARELLGVDT